MKTKFYISLVLMLGIGLLASPSAVASGWAWDRDAGAKARGEFGTTPRSKSSPTHSSRSYGRRLGQEPYSAARQVFSYEPAPSLVFKPGDVVVVAAEKANLMVGDRVLAAVPRGQHLTVSAVRDFWIGTSIQTNGQEIGGWLRNTEVVPLKISAASPVHAAFVSPGCGSRR